MNEPPEVGNNFAAPSDPAMAAAAPEIFTSLSVRENDILKARLASGWYKQRAIYPTLSEPLRETNAVLNDLDAAWRARREAEREPEAGL